MEIINGRRDINLRKGMEKMKDSYGLVRWGYKCV
jgi:hypothetical protein